MTSQNVSYKMRWESNMFGNKLQGKLFMYKINIVFSLLFKNPHNNIYIVMRELVYYFR